MTDNEKELFPLMPQGVKDELASTLLRSVRAWKGVSEEQLRNADERERLAQSIYALEEITHLNQGVKP